LKFWLFVRFGLVACNRTPLGLALSALWRTIFPWICTAPSFEGQAIGITPCTTAYDVAQGRGYAISEPVDNTAVIVKLFRVFLLLQVVLVVGNSHAVRSPRMPPKLHSPPSQSCSCC